MVRAVIILAVVVMLAGIANAQQCSIGDSGSCSVAASQPATVAGRTGIAVRAVTVATAPVRFIVNRQPVRKVLRFVRPRNLVGRIRGCR